jgi:hypothetical protein
MRTLSILSLILVFAGVKVAFAQDCTFYFPSEPGRELVYTTYSKPGKAESSVKQVITGKDVTDGKVRVGVNAEAFDAKGNSQGKFDYAVWCDGENFYVDMRSMLASMNLKNMGEVKIETTDLQFPSKLTPGMQLKDASITMTIEGPFNMGLSTNITNRKVEGVEEITTPAGTFNCFKITYTSSGKMMIAKVENNVTEWYAPNVGAVRSETYNSKNGKLVSINELTSLK